MTLIELLVVLAVLAVLSTGVSIAVARGVSPTETDLSQFRQQYTQLRAQAVHARQRYGLALTLEGRRMMIWRNEAWEPLGELRPWAGRVRHTRRGGPLARGEPEIQFLPNGQTSAFSISFDTQLCRSDGWASLTCGRG